MRLAVCFCLMLRACIKSEGLWRSMWGTAESFPKTLLDVPLEAPRPFKRSTVRRLEIIWGVKSGEGGGKCLGQGWSGQAGSSALAGHGGVGGGPPLHICQLFSEINCKVPELQTVTQSPHVASRVCSEQEVECGQYGLLLWSFLLFRAPFGFGSNSVTGLQSPLRSQLPTALHGPGWLRGASSSAADYTKPRGPGPPRS